jgi:hypothetical protein
VQSHLLDYILKLQRKYKQVTVINVFYSEWLAAEAIYVLISSGLMTFVWLINMGGGEYPPDERGLGPIILGGANAAGPQLCARPLKMKISWFKDSSTQYLITL